MKYKYDELENTEQHYFIDDNRNEVILVFDREQKSVTFDVSYNGIQYSNLNYNEVLDIFLPQIWVAGIEFSHLLNSALTLSTELIEGEN